MILNPFAVWLKIWQSARRPNGTAAPSPGQVSGANGALGGDGNPDGALKEQKQMNLQCGLGLLPFQGATSAGMGTQGVAHLRSLALGLELGGLSGRLPCGGDNINCLPCGVKILIVCLAGRGSVKVIGASKGRASNCYIYCQNKSSRRAQRIILKLTYK